MHHLLLITVVMPIGATSLDARTHAHAILQADDSFCGEGGRFGAPLGDWFVVGGRWSGVLQEFLFGDPYKEAFKAEFPLLAAGSCTNTLIEEHRVALDRLWR